MRKIVIDVESDTAMTALSRYFIVTIKRVIKKIKVVGICWKKPGFLYSDENGRKYRKEIPHFGPLRDQTTTVPLKDGGHEAYVRLEPLPRDGEAQLEYRFCPMEMRIGGREERSFDCSPGLGDEAAARVLLGAWTLVQEWEER